MSSINVNQGAMIALDTLKNINKDLGQVQSAISTGKDVNSSKDNAAIWSIATTMETDVAAFDKIGDSLNLGSATVGVARNASEDVVDYLQEAKDLIISAQESNVDREKIQTDIDELVAQVGSTVNAAQFNGQNLLSSGGSIEVLSSLDRGADGSVTASKITVDRQDLTTTAGTTTTITNASIDTASVANNGGATDAITFGTDVQEGDSYEFTVGSETLSVTAAAGDDNEALAAKLVTAITDAGITGVAAAQKGGALNTVTLDNTSGAAVAVASTSQERDNGDGGKLAGLESIDVTTDAGAADALTAIEGFLSSAIDAAAEFGSKQKRLDNQADFVSSLSDSLKTGVSTLVDADLEETSAKLQALQVQQQLGVQALSIANQAPSALLGLFR